MTMIPVLARKNLNVVGSVARFTNAPNVTGQLNVLTSTSMSFVPFAQKMRTYVIIAKDVPFVENSMGAANTPAMISDCDG